MSAVPKNIFFLITYLYKYLINASQGVRRVLYRRAALTEHTGLSFIRSIKIVTDLGVSCGGESLAG